MGSSSRNRRHVLGVAALTLLILCGGLLLAQGAGDALNARISITALVNDDGWDRALRAPSALFFDERSGELFVADAGNNRVLVLDRNLGPRYSFLHFVPEYGTGRPIKGEPRDLVVNSRGEILLIDNHAEFVDVLDFRGTPVDRIMLDRLQGDTSLTIRPQTIAIGPDDYLYIGTAGDVVGVFILDPDFRIVRVIGQSSADVRPFQTIMAVAVYDSILYVTDLHAEPAVKLFTLDGRYLSGFAKHDVDRADLSFPSGIAVMTDESGQKTIWITDGLRQTVKVYYHDGAFLAFVGGFGVKPGEFRYPADIAASGDSLFYILERTGGRISRFVID